MTMSAEQVLQQFNIMASTLGEMTKTLALLQERPEGGGKGGGKGSAERKGNGRIEGKMVEMFKNFHGGEIEWNAWADDFKIMIDAKSEELGATLEFIRGLGKTDKEVMGWRDVRLMMHEAGEAVGLDDLDEAACGRMSK